MRADFARAVGRRGRGSGAQRLWWRVFVRFGGLPRAGRDTAEEIAGPILFLASELSNGMTAEILNVNCGSVLCG